MDTGTGGTGTDFHSNTGHFGKCGTTPIPVPDTSVSSVQHQYRYRTLWQVRHNINTGTGHFVKLGTTSIPVPSIPVPYRTHLRGSPSECLPVSGVRMLGVHVNLLLQYRIPLCRTTPPVITFRTLNNLSSGVLYSGGVIYDVPRR